MSTDRAIGLAIGVVVLLVVLFRLADDDDADLDGAAIPAWELLD